MIIFEPKITERNQTEPDLTIHFIIISEYVFHFQWGKKIGHAFLRVRQLSNFIEYTSFLYMPSVNVDICISLTPALYLSMYSADPDFRVSKSEKKVIYHV